MLDQNGGAPEDPWVRSNSQYDPATRGTGPGERIADEARILAERPIASSESRRAFVAVRAHIFGLGRMMEIYHEPLGCTQVFYSMDEAVKWIERREDKISKS
jgi:hypothetical protein